MVAVRNLSLFVSLMVITDEINGDDRKVTYYKFDMRLSLHCNNGECGKLNCVWQN
jgi:hypothetical protein